MSHNSKKRKIKKIVRYTVLTVAVLTFAVSLLMLMNTWEKNRGVFSNTDAYENSEVVYNGKKYEIRDNVETFLVIGLDKFDNFKSAESYNNDMQADFLMLLVFDNEAKKCTGIQINRDTMVDVSVLGVAGNRVDTVTEQIALSHTYGNGRDVSCRNTADSVSLLLNGMKVNHYISLTMDSVAIMNDSIGGVEVTVLDDFSGIDSSLVKGEKVTLMGEQALTYVRSRKGMEDSSNISRMKRQRQYIEALYSKFTELSDGDKNFAFEAVRDISEYIVSDRSITQLQELAEKFMQYEFTGIRAVEGDSLKGEKYMEFYADSKAVDEIVFELFYAEKAE